MLDLKKLTILFNKINDIIDYIEKSHFHNRTQKIFLSNGDIINIQISLDSIPKLLGINIEYASNIGLIEEHNKFDGLKKLCQMPYTIYKGAESGIINYSSLFQDNMINKIDKFKDSIKINVFETMFVCKQINTSCLDYSIVRTYVDGKIGIIQLKKQINHYVPINNIIFENMDQCKKNLAYLINGQNLTLINSSSIIDEKNLYENNIFAPVDLKIRKLNMLIALAKDFYAKIDVFSDYRYMLNKLSYLKDNQKFKDELYMIKQQLEILKVQNEKVKIKRA